MRGVILVLTVLIPAITALARVNIYCSADGNEVTIGYDVISEPNKVRAFALDITVDCGAKIKSISYVNPYYWVYPGSIQIVNGEVNDVGSPVCDPNSPGALGGLDTNGITIEMGALYYPAGDNSPNAPPLRGKLLTFTVNKDCCVSVRGNKARGGIVMTDPNLIVDAYFLGSCDHCYPGYTTFAIRKRDWLDMGKPLCWCGQPWTTGYQCDGDSDNATQGLQKFRVFTNDFNIMVANWKKLVADPTLNPCADFDHKPQGLQKFRVFTNDFNILVSNWKKTDAQLPGNCPRP